MLSAPSRRRQFTNRDVRILFAIARAQRFYPGDILKGIFEAEDGVNRSAPTPDELRDSLSILLGSALIIGHDEGYILTPRGEQILEERDRIRGSFFDRTEVLASELSTEYGEVELVPVELEDEAIMRAYASYYSGT